MQVVLELVITLCKLIMGYDIHNNYQRPISYQMCRELINLDKTLEEYNLLCDKNINSYSELISFIIEIKHQISQYENERNKIYNKILRADNDEKVILKEKAKEITKQIAPLRKQLNISSRINGKLDKYKQLLQEEMSLEQNISLKIRDKQRKER